MSGGKETPRQKMVGLMYLVLMALLALNVTKEVLNAFVAIEENVQKGALTQLDRGDISKKELIEAQEASNPEKIKKIKYFLGMIEKIDDETAKRIQEIDALKISLLQKSGEEINKIKDKDKETIIWTTYSKKQPLKPSRLNLMAVEAKDQFDIPMHEIIGEDLTNITGSGRKLWENYNNYRNKLCDLLGTYTPPGGKVWNFKSNSINTFDSNIDLITQIDKMMSKNKYNDKDDKEVIKQIYMELTKNERYDTEEVKNMHWIGKTFDHSPLVAAIASLTALQQEILSARATAVTHLKNKIGVGEYSFNKVMAISYGDVIANQGEEIEVGVMMAAYDSDNQPVVTTNSGQVTIADGKGKIKVKASSGTEMKLNGTVSIKKKTGETKTEKWERTVKIMKPQGNISVAGMNVLYRNYDNMIVGVASGYDETILNAVSGVKLVRKGKDYYAYPDGSRTCKISISGKNSVTNKTVSLGTQDFRVVAMPKPSLFLGSLTSGDTKPANVIKMMSRMSAKYTPDILLKSDYKIVKWRIVVEGAPKEEEGYGETLSLAAIKILNQLKPGKTVTLYCDCKGYGMLFKTAPCVITAEK